MLNVNLPPEAEAALDEHHRTDGKTISLEEVAERLGLED